jgi:CheY-like chemotaxis protein
MKKYTIIIVENDEDEQFFMKEGFDATGLFEIIAQVTNGDDLLDWLQDHPSVQPDLVLSDLNMPGKNGLDILDAFKSNPKWAQIPVIITSTSSTKSIIDKCYLKGAADYMVKPDTFIEYQPFVKNLHQLVVQKKLAN